ncbi:MAG: hypothetical protein GY769_09820 [bacterium]|nr:hypothetical protein [bacterium]
MHRTTIALILPAVALFAGCQGGASSAKSPADSTEPRHRAEAPSEQAEPAELAKREPESPAPSQGVFRGIPPELFAAARADCAARSGKSEEALQVVRAEVVTWRDGSLGCPEPGLMYIHALVEGYWLVFNDGERDYDYRAGRGGNFMYCARPKAGPAPSDAA